MWETRYGFPVPTRLPSGHRRYSDDDVAHVRQVARDREAGLSMKAAIDRVREAPEEPDASIFAGVRRRRPDLQPYVLPKDALIGLSYAIGDECAARAGRPVLSAASRRGLFGPPAGRRGGGSAPPAPTPVFSPFSARPRGRAPRHEPVELPIRRNEPLGREWA